jgi:glycosyltransferase involved in cell wall biosynthesis
MNNPAILVAHHRPDIVSGAEIAIADMVKSCAPGWRFIMLVPGAGALANYYRGLNIPVWEKSVTSPRRLFPGLHQLESWLFARQLQKAHISGVIANTFPAASRVISACEIAKIPCAIYVREYMRPLAHYRKLFNRAARILAVSQSVENHVRSMGVLTEIDVAYDVILAEKIRARLLLQSGEAHPLSFEPGVPVIGWIGRLTPYKQPDLFLKAIPFVLQKFPKAKFLLIGSAKINEKEYEASLYKLSAHLGIDDCVEFLGQRSDVIDILANLTVVCVTSTREPFSRVILEAQVMGCPVIAPDTGGSPEAVEDEVTGLLFHPLGDTAACDLAERIIRVLADQKLAEQLRAQASASVNTNFASRNPTRKFEELLTDMAEKYEHQG